MSDDGYDPGWWGDEEQEWADRVERFADPGGDSALHPATDDNPRDLPCPTCHWPNRLTQLDRARGYQCDACANATERGQDIAYYEGDDAADEVVDATYGTADQAEKERY